MSEKNLKHKPLDDYKACGKANYLLTGGGNITCLRCTANSTRTKQQCGRPAVKTSRTQKCQYHGGRPHSAETLKRIADAHLAANLVNPGARLCLLKCKGNLLVRKSALFHGMSPFSIGEISCLS
jgi:hypothetical protein